MAKKLESPAADPVINRLRDVAGVTSDIALGEYFGHGPTAVSNWRQRGRVPYPECVDVAKRKGLSLDWLVFGEPHPPMRDAVDAVHDEGRGDRYTVTVLAPIDERDPRVERMIGFIRNWAATRDSDEVVWLERTLARTVAEYAEWLVVHKD